MGFLFPFTSSDVSFCNLSRKISYTSVCIDFVELIFFSCIFFTASHLAQSFLWLMLSWMGLEEQTSQYLNYAKRDGPNSCKIIQIMSNEYASNTGIDFFHAFLKHVPIPEKRDGIIPQVVQMFSCFLNFDDNPKYLASMSLQYKMSNLLYQQNLMVVIILMEDHHVNFFFY